MRSDADGSSISAVNRTVATVAVGPISTVAIPWVS
jgi:hypothetical protein